MTPMSEGEGKRGAGIRRRQVMLAGLGAVAPALAEGALRFGYFDRYAPLSERVLDGRATGLLVERVELVVRSAGLEAEHWAYPWPRAQRMVAMDRLDGFCTMDTPEREQYAHFGREVLLEDATVVVHRRDDARATGLRRPEDLAGLRVGTYRGDSFSRRYLGDALLRFDDGPDSVLRRIAMGDLDAFVEGQQITQGRLKRLGLEQALVITPLRFVPTARFRIGLRRSLPQVMALLARLDQAALQLRRAGRLPLNPG